MSGPLGDAVEEPVSATDYEARLLSEPGPVGLFTRLTRVGLLVDAFQHRCFDRFGLLFIDYSVLRVLQLSGSPYRTSPTELADIVLRSSGGMTQILDRLRAGRARGAQRRPDGPAPRPGRPHPEPACGRPSRERGLRGRARAPARRARPTTEVEQLDGAIRRLLDVLTDDALRAREPDVDAAVG